MIWALQLVVTLVAIVSVVFPLIWFGTVTSVQSVIDWALVFVLPAAVIFTPRELAKWGSDKLAAPTTLSIILVVLFLCRIYLFREEPRVFGLADSLLLMSIILLVGQLMKVYAFGR